MLNLDTHILVFALAGKLSTREKRLLSREPWGISAIVLWELTKLTQLGRIEMDLDDSEVLQILSEAHVWPITLEICRAMTRLDSKSDPADELIAATSIVHDAPLVTRDRRIRKSRLVPFA